MNVWCPDINCQRTSLTCIYRCKINTKCAEYTKLYEKICENPVEEKYIEKYGQPVYPEPLALLKKQKAAEKKLKDDAKKALLNEKKAAKRARDKAKKDKEALKLAKVKEREKKKAEKEAKKGKRTRRTKEQIQADLRGNVQEAPQTEPVQKKTRQRKVLSPAVAGTLKPEVVKAAIQEVIKRRSTADKFAMFDDEEVVPIPEKKKRHRRTKTEIEADRKAVSGVNFFLD